MCIHRSYQCTGVLDAFYLSDILICTHHNLHGSKCVFSDQLLNISTTHSFAWFPYKLESFTFNTCEFSMRSYMLSCDWFVLAICIAILKGTMYCLQSHLSFYSACDFVGPQKFISFIVDVMNV